MSCVLHPPPTEILWALSCVCTAETSGSFRGTWRHRLLHLVSPDRQRKEVMASIHPKTSKVWVSIILSLKNFCMESEILKSCWQSFIILLRLCRHACSLRGPCCFRAVSLWITPARAFREVSKSPTRQSRSATTSSRSWESSGSSWTAPETEWESPLRNAKVFWKLKLCDKSALRCTQTLCSVSHLICTVFCSFCSWLTLEKTSVGVERFYVPCHDGKFRHSQFIV